MNARRLNGWEGNLHDIMEDEDIVDDQDMVEDEDIVEDEYVEEDEEHEEVKIWTLFQLTRV
jgi:hypothetical protein